MVFKGTADDISNPFINIYTLVWLKGLYRKNERGYRLKPENLRSWTIHIRHLSDVLVSRYWHKTVSKLYKTYIYVRYTSVSCNQNSLQWECSILVTWYRRRHLTIISALPLVGVLLKMKNYWIQIIIGANLSSSGSFKGTANVISSGTSIIDRHVGFTTVPYTFFSKQQRSCRRQSSILKSVEFWRFPLFSVLHKSAI